MIFLLSIDQDLKLAHFQIELFNLFISSVDLLLETYRVLLELVYLLCLILILLLEESPQFIRPLVFEQDMLRDGQTRLKG